MKEFVWLINVYFPTAIKDGFYSRIESVFYPLLPNDAMIVVSDFYVRVGKGPGHHGATGEHSHHNMIIQAGS